MPREPNDRLREAITAGDWTYESLARAIRRVAAENGEILRTNKSAIAHWVSGARPGERTACYLAEALSRRAGQEVTPAQAGLVAAGGPALIGQDAVGTASVLGRADVEHRTFLAAAAFTVAGVALPLAYDQAASSRMLRARTGTAVAGASEIDVIRQVTKVFGAADEALGGAHGLTAVAAYLADTAAPILRGRFPARKSGGRRSVRSQNWPTSPDSSITTWGRRALRSVTTCSASS